MTPVVKIQYPAQCANGNSSASPNLGVCKPLKPEPTSVLDLFFCPFIVWGIFPYTLFQNHPLVDGVLTFGHPFQILNAIVCLFSVFMIDALPGTNRKAKPRKSDQPMNRRELLTAIYHKITLLITIGSGGWFNFYWSPSFKRPQNPGVRNLVSWKSWNFFKHNLLISLSAQHCQFNGWLYSGFRKVAK